jgi:hypothetical protein
MDQQKLEMYIRKRGLELYWWKPSKFSDDLKKEAIFVKTMVNKVRKNKID